MNTATPIRADALRLWQLISPALPVGAYAYSQGLEYAVQAGWVHDARSAGDWIVGQLDHALAGVDVPVFARLYSAWKEDDPACARHWSRFLLAGRETAERLFEERQLGQALARLLADLDMPEAAPWREDADASFAALFALAAARWRIPCAEAAAGYLWAWCENQAAAAVKLIPLGQTAGQRILSRALTRIPAAVADGLAREEADIGAGAPGLAIACCLHEIQYTRLFRS